MKDNIDSSNESPNTDSFKKFPSRRTTAIITRLTFLLLAFASCYSSVSDAISDNKNQDEDDDTVPVVKLDPKITYYNVYPSNQLHL